MDFKKVARIFIVAFFLLNIYLFFGVLKREGTQYTSTQPNKSDIFMNMNELGINIPDMSELSIENQEIYSLQVNKHELLEEEIKENKELKGTLNDDDTYYMSFPSNPIVLTGDPKKGFEEEDYEVIKDFVNSKEVMFGSEYSKIRFDSGNNRFVLNQHIDNIPIMDGTSEISLFVNQLGEIFAFQQTYAGPATHQGNSLDLIDAYRAVEILFINNEIRQDSEIKTPILTYRRALDLKDLSMYSPVWLIDIKHGSEEESYLIDAVDGTIIRQAEPILEDNSEDLKEDKEESEN